MPKKTAYSRSGAPRNKTKQKSFELVRPASDDRELDATAESDEEESSEEDVVAETSSSVSSEEEAEEVEQVSEVKTRRDGSAGSKAIGGKSAAAVSVAPAASAASTSVSTSPKSAAARLAERKQAQKQRAAANLITVEHYNYVRKDLIFILILAVILFGIIIALHFILGN
jgi:NADH dehydrogenase/NADH:ubiquinone oxidoreductase subunit G